MNEAEFTIEDATDFFGKVFNGTHHIPSRVRSWGYGWFTWTHTPLATFDFNILTRLVVLAHDECVRVEICTHYFHGVKIILHKRQGREGAMSQRHPTLEDGIADARNYLGGR